MDRAEIIKAFDAHAKASGLKRTTIGQYAVRDRKIYDRLVDGGGVSERVLKALSEWLSQNQLSDDTPKTGAA